MKKWLTPFTFILILLLVPGLSLGGSREEKQKRRQLSHEFREEFVRSIHNVLFEIQKTGRPKIQQTWPAGAEPASPEDQTVYVEDDLFAPKFNPSASTFKAWTLEFLLANIKQMPREKEARNADREALLDMNARAIELWDRLVLCSGDDESAREAYAAGQFKCGNSDSGEQIATALTELHANALDFFKTTDIEGTIEVLRRSKQHPVVPMHPLLSQAVEEIFAVWFPFAKNNAEFRKWLRRSMKTEDSIEKSNRMLNLIRIIDFEAMPVGLWPAALRRVHAYTLAKFANLQKNSSQVLSQSERVGFFSMLTEDCYGDGCELFLLHPLYWLGQTIHWGYVAYQDHKSIEPNPGDVTRLENDEDVAYVRTERGRKSKSPYLDQTRATLERLRQMAKSYGISEKSLLD